MGIYIYVYIYIGVMVGDYIGTTIGMLYRGYIGNMIPYSLLTTSKV